MVYGKKAVIVGAGIAGLSTGCYLQMNGYDTEIYESHRLPGGLCTSWKRKDYTIEGCLHGLLGSSPSHPLYSLWNEIVDMQQVGFIDSEAKHVFKFSNGKVFTEYADLNLLEEEMIRTGPEDRDIIQSFIRDIRKIQRVSMSYDKPREFLDVAGSFKMIKSAPVLLVLKKWLRVSSHLFADQFRNPFLNEVVKHFSSPILFEMFVLSEMDLKRCGYPIIGSLEFSRQFEQKYNSLGGVVHYNQKVVEVMTEKDRAVGIRCENGETHHADMVISAADGRQTLFHLLDGRYLSKKTAECYDRKDLNPSKIQVSLGVNRPFNIRFHSEKIILDTPLTISDGSHYDAIDVLIYSDIEQIAPKGKSLLVVQLDTMNGEFWSELRKNQPKRYKEEKNIIAESVIQVLEMFLSSIKEKLEMVDVATPATYIRYTGNWNGSIQGWSNENIFRANPFQKELPGLKQFYMVGQWVEPGGGIPNVFKSGRDLAQIICRKDKKHFHH